VGSAVHCADGGCTSGWTQNGSWPAGSSGRHRVTGLLARLDELEFPCKQDRKLGSGPGLTLVPHSDVEHGRKLLGLLGKEAPNSSQSESHIFDIP